MRYVWCREICFVCSEICLVCREMLRVLRDVWCAVRYFVCCEICLVCREKCCVCCELCLVCREICIMCCEICLVCRDKFSVWRFLAAKCREKKEKTLRSTGLRVFEKVPFMYKNGHSRHCSARDGRSLQNSACQWRFTEPAGSYDIGRAL